MAETAKGVWMMNIISLLGAMLAAMILIGLTAVVVAATVYVVKLIIKDIKELDYE